MCLRTPFCWSCVSLLICAASFAEDPSPPSTQIVVTSVVAAANANGAVKVVAVRNAQQQQSAAKKLLEAQKAEAEATNALAAALDDATKATARVAEAKKKLEEAKKAVAAAREAARKQAAAQAVVVRSYGPQANTVAVRENVDPQDPIERFLLLAPGGPLVVQVAMTIDGQPFRTARESLIDELLAAADKDADGKASWDEALSTPRFTLGRIRIVNDEQRRQYIKAVDKDENGLVDRDEVRRFLAQYYQGPAFALGTGYGYSGYGRAVFLANGRMVYSGGSADVQKFLDTDGDGVLSEAEIAEAGLRLKSRDADDNDLLYPQEIDGPVTAANRRTRAYARPPQPALALLLGPTASADAIFKSLQAQYKNADGKVVAGSFATVPDLFKALDKNDDGKLQQDETLALNGVAPHLELVLDLGKNDKPKGLTIKRLAPPLTKVKEAAQAVSLELPGVKLNLTANLVARWTYNYEQTAKSYLTNFDKDGNGYLQKDELQAGLAQQFELWDDDGDGKVFAAEITASYTRMQAPQASQIRANAANQGNSLFEALDLSGDGRLSLREMRTAHLRIKTFDGDNDGRITQGEIPVTLSVSFGLGNTGYGVYRLAGQGNRGAAVVSPAANGDAPDWFTRMDRNGDGDVTLKEFLGDKEQFEKLDTNGDGFIEPKEAKAAG